MAQQIKLAIFSDDKLVDTATGSGPLVLLDHTLLHCFISFPLRRLDITTTRSLCMEKVESVLLFHQMYLLIFYELYHFEGFIFFWWIK
jgi:hypothetical protein